MAELWIQKQLEKQVTRTVLNGKQLALAIDPSGEVVTDWTIRNWRLQGGLPYFSVGHRIFYVLESVLEWLDKKEHESSSKKAETEQYGVLRKIT